MTNSSKIQSRLSNKICPDGMSIEEWQIALRRENAQEAQFIVEHLDDNRIWGDYLVSSTSGRYRIAFRGVCSDRNFCSCLDFRTNGLGTCKHIEAVALFLQEHVPGYPWAGMTYSPSYTSVYVSYKGGRNIRMRIGSEYTEEFLRLYNRYFDKDGVLPFEHYELLEKIAEEGKAISSSFRLYEDVHDFASGQIMQANWRAELADSFPEKRIPWNREYLSDEYSALEEALYSLCHGFYGVIVGGSHPIFTHLIARLAEEIYQGVEVQKVGYIVVDNEADVLQWKTVLGGYSEFAELPIRILSSTQFITLIGNEYSDASFVYIDNASGLKNWQNPVSLAVKRLSIDHLYMRIDTLQSLTPVQLSSILQHINPFVIGPFYKFIHQYRPIFPLRDDGSNMPAEAAPLIYLCSDLPKQVDLKRVTSLTVAPTEKALEVHQTSQSKVDALLKALCEVASDPEALALLRSKTS